ncbi:MAG: Fic family protein [Planctomycetaceae bacterium]|nr:Fic family protein [Planctomycetaceae bacterium]
MRNDWEFIIDSPSEASLSPDEKARVEATNAIAASLMLDALAQFRNRVHLGKELLKTFHSLFCDGIPNTTPGQYRTKPCTVSKNHVPPKAREIDRLIDEMFEYASRFEDHSYHVSAFLLWRIVWIHPFNDGNGRVARTFCYLSLCQSLDTHFGGRDGFASYFLQRTDEYYAALEAADRAWLDSDQDLQQPLNLHSLEMLIADALSSQLQS